MYHSSSPSREPERRGGSGHGASAALFTPLGSPALIQLTDLDLKPARLRELLAILPLDRPVSNPVGIISKLKAAIERSGLADVVDERLKDLILQARRVYTRRKPFADRAVAWLTGDGILAVGIETQHENPPQWTSAEVGASTALLLAKRLDHVVGFFIRDECPTRRHPLAGYHLDLMRHHLHSGLRDGVVSARHAESPLRPFTRFNKICKFPEFPSIPASRLKIRDLTSPGVPAFYRLPMAFDTNAPQADMIKSVVTEVLMRAIGCSTSDGENAPATKSHAAAAIYGDRMLVAVNGRDADYPKTVRCAEAGLTALSTHLHVTRPDEWPGFWHALVVYSPDYVSADATHSLTPGVCTDCCGKLAERLDPRFRLQHDDTAEDMWVYAAGREAVDSLRLSRYPMLAFEKREKLVKRGLHGNGNGG